MSKSSGLRRPKCLKDLKQHVREQQSSHGPQMPFEILVFPSNDLPTTLNLSSVLFNFLTSISTFSEEPSSSNI